MKLNDLGRLIFLDRYAKKDMTRTFRPDDEVVVYIDPESKQRELANVVSVGSTAIDVKLQKSGDLVRIPVTQADKPIENLDAAHMRIAKGLATPEYERNYDTGSRYEQDFFYELHAGHFQPAGRIMAGAGLEEKLTPYNCYVLPAPKDSRHGINETEGRMVEIMCRGGGVGIPIMSLRPRHALVRGVNGRSSGSVLWAESFSFKTGLVEQGGSRRGALILVQYIWHPDVIEFINAKKDKTRLTNANISVGITDDFMAAVEADADWQLVFPDTTHPKYDEVWDGDLNAWKAAGLPLVVHQTMPARELWDMIVESAWKSAEPGLLFVDRYNGLSNSWYYPEGRIFATNPCGEQGLPQWGVCNLGHINLSQMLIGDGMGEASAEIDWAKLKQTIRRMVRFMDNVIDVAYAPFEENKAQQLLERRVGLGTMGVAEMMIRCHVRYGRNQRCMDFLDRLYKFIAVEAYRASVELAIEKGPFPAFEAEQFLQSGFMVGMPEEIRALVAKYGIRNVTLLTQAPTGTVGTMVATSTGIEPFFAWEWERSGRLGTHKEYAAIYAEFREKNPLFGDVLPEWFVTANELTPEDHAYTQAWIQRWVDSSISKTSNLPADYTPEAVGEYYKLLHKLGCKGGTVYRDGSRDVQVLNTVKEAPAPVQATAAREELKSNPSDAYDLKGVSVMSPVGKLSLKLGLDEMGEPFEAWVGVSRSGSVVSAHAEAMGRLMSLVLRMDSPIAPKRRLEIMQKQLAGIGGGDSIGMGPNRILSMPDSIAKGLGMLRGALEQEVRMLVDVPVEKTGTDNVIKAKVIQLQDVCPSCHASTLVRSEGCQSCSSCGYSRC